MSTTRARRSTPWLPLAATVSRYGLVGLALASVLSIAVGLFAAKAGDVQADRSAERAAAVVGGSVVAPLVTPALAAGDRAAQERLGAAVDALVVADIASAVTVRDAEGRVVWSTDAAAIGTSAPLSAAERTALRRASVVPTGTTGQAAGSRPAFRTAAVGVTDASGAPAVVDVTDTATTTRPAWAHAVPVALTCLLCLEVVQLPLAYGLARQVRRRGTGDPALARAAAEASDGERRRLAAEVHDYVIPELSGLAYDLDAARLATVAPARPDPLLARTAAGLRQNVGELRRLLSDPAPARLPADGLEAALEMLGGRMGGGPEVSVSCPRSDELPRQVTEVLYRCAQESLRNAAAHSRAERVEIVVERDGDQVSMTVDDDGCGFEAAELAAREATGHMGLRTLGAMVADGGGSLTARSAPGQGTRMIVTLPLTAPAPRAELVR
jgi:two-component system, NarL family, sensor kinase